MDELIRRIVKLPMALKAGVVLGLAVAISAGNYFYFIGGVVDDIRSQNRSLDSLYDELARKNDIANNYELYQREMERLEEELEDALTRIPPSTRMDDLITQLADTADEAGLSLSSMTPQSHRQEDTFYYRIPVRMQVRGTYHEIAVFLDRVRGLRRIINVNNIDLGSPSMRDGEIVLNASYLASTFRFAVSEDDD